MRGVSFLAWFVVSVLPVSAAEVVLVRDSQARSEIVIAEQAPRMTKLAAKELQQFAEKISGAKIGIVTKPSGGELIPIFIGKSPHTDAMQISDAGLDHGAFRLIVKDGAVVLLGRDTDFVPPEPFARHNGDIPRATAEWDKLTKATWGFPHTQVYKCRDYQLGIWEQDERGSFNAVTEVLRRLGVRWFLPGELGEVVPQAKTIVLKTGDETIKPDFALRWPYQYFKHFSSGQLDETMWQLRLGISVAPEIIGLSEFGHGTRVVHERAEFSRANPECFALFGGQRATNDRTDGGKPCLSSPKLFEENVRFVRAMFDIYREPMVSVMPEDGYTALCQCELCKGKGSPERGWEGQISDYVWDYVDRVGREVLKTHPDRRIHCLAYGAYQAPPTKIEKLSPNIVVGIAQHRAGFFDAKDRKHHDELRAAWLKKTSQPLYVWDYYLHTRPGHTWEFMPMYFPRAIASDLKSLKGRSLGDFIEVNREQDGIKLLATTHLNLYVTSRYWWDAEQDIDALLADYYSQFYGPAAAAMRDFIEYSEANWMKLREQPALIDGIFARMQAAQSAAPAGSIHARRVALIADYIAPLKELREQFDRKRQNVPHVQLLTNDDKPIVVDGKLDEELWQRPGGWGLVDLETGRTPIFLTSFKAAWQKDSLVMAITCRDQSSRHKPNQPDRASGRFEREPKSDAKSNPEPGASAPRLISSDYVPSDGYLSRLAPKLAHDDSTIWNGDVIELLIETQAHSYYQIAINPQGSIADLDRLGGKLNSLWKSGIQVATQRADDHWTVELRLPIASEEQAVLNPLDGVAGRAPSRTYPWHFNVCRQRVGRNGVELSALSPTGADNFHVLDRFAILNLKPGGFQQDNPSLNPDFKQGYILQRQAALELIKAGKDAEALAAFKQLATTKLTDHQQADALDQAIDCAVRLKQPDEAATLARQIRSKPHAKLARMKLFSNDRRWATIISEFESDPLEAWPDTLIGYAATFRGQAHFIAKNGPRAERDLLTAADWLTDTNWQGESLLSLGRTYRQLLKDDTKAIAAFRRVYATGNEFKHCSAACEVSDILRLQGKRDEAKAELNRIDQAQMTIPVYRDMLRKAKAQAEEQQ